MKMPSYGEGPFGYERGIEHLELSFTIRDWRGGKDDETGKICPFNKLDMDKDVPAKEVAAHAQKLADSLHPDSRFIAEKPKLEAVVAYARRCQLLEEAEYQMRYAIKKAVAAGMRYRDTRDLFETQASKVEWES